jgi:hypothetical protein
MMRTDIIAHQMNRADALVDFHIHRFEKGHEFPLSLPFITVPVDPTRASVKGGKEIERPRPLVLMLNAGGQVIGLGGQGRGQAGPRLQGGLLIKGEHDRIGPEGTGVEVNELGDGGIKGGVPRVFGVEPQMMTPGLQLMRGQNPPHRRGRDILNAPRCDELTRQFGAIPRGEPAAQHVGPLAGQAHEVDRHLRGENCPWLHGQGRLQGRPSAGRERVWPPGGPPCVARRPPAPPRIERTLPPGAG